MKFTKKIVATATFKKDSSSGLEKDYVIQITFEDNDPQYVWDELANLKTDLKHMCENYFTSGYECTVDIEDCCRDDGECLGCGTKWDQSRAIPTKTSCRTEDGSIYTRCRVCGWCSVCDENHS